MSYAVDKSVFVNPGRHSSFASMNRAELAEVCKHYGIQFDDEPKRLPMIEALSLHGKKPRQFFKEAGIERNKADDSTLENKFGAKEIISAGGNIIDANDNDIPDKVQQGPYPIKMIRHNDTYSIRGYKFTKANPYRLVESKEDAAYLVREAYGFIEVSKAEIAEFYRGKISE